MKQVKLNRLIGIVGYIIFASGTLIVYFDTKKPFFSMTVLGLVLIIIGVALY